MINIINGNILNCKEDIIVHQVNTQGLMGGGLARQLADRYSVLEYLYSQYCKKYNNEYEKLKGKNYIIHIENKYICSIFTQKDNLDVDYDMMYVALTKVKEFAITNKLSISIPYNIGCGIGNGNWDKVYKIIEKVFNNYDVTLYKYL